MLLGSAGWRCYGWGWRRRCWRCPYGLCGGGGYGDGHHKRDVATATTDDKKAVENEAGAAAEPVETDEMVEEPHDMAAECTSFSFPPLLLSSAPRLTRCSLSPPEQRTASVSRPSLPSLTFLAADTVLIPGPQATATDPAGATVAAGVTVAGGVTVVDGVADTAAAGGMVAEDGERLVGGAFLVLLLCWIGS